LLFVKNFSSTKFLLLFCFAKVPDTLGNIDEISQNSVLQNFVPEDDTKFRESLYRISYPTGTHLAHCVAAGWPALLCPITCLLEKWFLLFLILNPLYAFEASGSIIILKKPDRQ
jgi:hypothetical protein